MTTNYAALLLRIASVALAVSVAACGGGTGDVPGNPPAPPPPSPTPPPPAALRVVPAAVSLDVSDSGQLYALGGATPVAWSSSDDTVVTVNERGELLAAGRGTAVVTARAGTASVTATVRVFDTRAATPDATSRALIRKALRENRLSADQALLYQVFAAFGDPRLPAEYLGAPSAESVSLLLREVSGRLPSLPVDLQAQLRPFLLPPIYAESWDAQQFAPPASQLAATANQRVRAQAVSDSCTQMAFGRRLVSTANFNVWIVDMVDRVSLGSDVLGDLELASYVGALLEDIYGKETTTLQRFPKGDSEEPCNGGDGAVDVYITQFMDSTRPAETKAYPNRCQGVPAFIKLNRPRLANMARVGFEDAARPYWKGVLAHEFMHVLQFGMTRPAACTNYDWIDEATAQWAMDLVEPADNMEDGVRRVAAQRRSGQFYANYLLNEHMVAIETPGSDANEDLNGYSDYIFFQYLARKHGPQVIKQIFDAMTRTDSVDALYQGLAAAGGMEKIWHEFARVLWNDTQNPVLDNLASIDGYDFGLVHVFAGTARDLSARKPANTPIVLQGAGRANFELLKTAQVFGGGYEIAPRSIHYEHLKFDDDSVAAVLVHSPLTGTNRGDALKLQAVQKIAGQWKPVEDWTRDGFKFFCRDKADERLQELILIVSYSENVPATQPLRISPLLPLTVSTSNVGCWKWQGSATQTISASASGGSGELISRAMNVDWEPSIAPSTTMLFIRFKPTGGIANGLSVVNTPPCTQTMTGPNTPIAGPSDESAFTLNLDLKTSLLPTYDRKLQELRGTTTIDGSARTQCPNVDSTVPVRTPWTWLGLELLTRPLSVSDDGRTITADVTEGDASARTRHQFTFTAMRE